jgi:hypothetical protein
MPITPTWNSTYLSITPHSVGVKANVSLWCDVISWRHPKTTGKTVQVKVIVRQFAGAKNGTLAGDYPAFDTTETETDLELQKEVMQKKLHRMAKVYNLFVRWQGSENLILCRTNLAPKTHK